jgi:hypothetical protein
MRKVVGLLFLVAIVAALSGCGGDGKSEAEREAEANSGRGTVTCEGSAMSGETGLPADFPQIEGITYVNASEAGPSKVVDGYVGKSVEEAYDFYKSSFEDAGYAVLFDELEKDDAEVSYRTKDKASEGQVALRACDEDKTSLHITNRPE